MTEISEEAWKRAAKKQIRTLRDDYEDDLDFRVYTFEWEHCDPSDPQSGVTVVEREALAEQQRLDAAQTVTDEMLDAYEAAVPSNGVRPDSVAGKAIRLQRKIGMEAALAAQHAEERG